MDAKTLTALRGSIAKWRDIVDGNGADEGTDNCPLCVLFYENLKDDIRCYGCPVRIHTLKENCIGSPWQKWARLHINEGGLPWGAKTPQQKAAAQAELDFLISLLPEGESATSEQP